MTGDRWTKQDTDDLRARWNESGLPTFAFAQDYAEGVGRTYNAVRMKVAELIREGAIDPHKSNISPAKVLVLDIETLPMHVRAWGLREQNLRPENVICDTVVVSVAATWLYSGKVVSFCMTPKEALKRDDRRVIEGMWNLLDRAEIVVAHYGRGFDLPKLNARFLFYHMFPPTPYRVIDTAKDIQTVGLSSKKQDYILTYLNLKRKLETNYQLWLDCEAGKKKALADMERYNRNDVMTLEAMYSVLRPWISGHPSLDVFEGVTGTRCPRCVGRLSWTNSRWAGTVKLYPTFRCKKCGAVGRGKQRS